MSIDYAREKFWQAIDILATTDNTIQVRLAGAALYLIRLRPEDFPEDLQQEFKALMHDLTKEKAIGDEGTIEATIRKLTSQEAHNSPGASCISIPSFMAASQVEDEIL